MLRTRTKLFAAAVIILPVLLILFILHLLYPSLHREYRLQDLGPGFRPVKSRNITLYTNVPGDDVVFVAGILDTFFTDFLNQFGSSFSMREMEKNPEFWVFRSVEELQAHFSKKHSRDLFNSGGYYDSARGVIAIPWAGTTVELIESVLHEGTHLLFDQLSGANSPNWSPWLSEGLACYFGSSRLQGMRLILGGFDPYLLRIFRKSRLRGEGISLERLLEAPYDRFLEEGNVLWYAASQLLVYFLLEGEGGELRPRFFEYYDRERLPGPCSIVEFHSVFGNDLEGLTTRWWAFLETLEDN